MGTVVAPVSVNMINPAVWFGTVTVANSSQITLVNGNITGTYYGSFSYDFMGNVFGTLTGLNTWVGATLTLTVSGLSLNANTYYNSIQSGNGVAAVTLALAGSDSIFGSNFNDSLGGYAGNDRIDANDGNDYALGGDGADTLIGSSGADSLYGDAGFDRLFGGIGSDLLHGGAGADILTGGYGKDTMNGGMDRAADVFDFNSANETSTGAGADHILGFRRGDDKIDLRDIDANTASMVNNAFGFTATTATAHSVWFVVKTDGILIRGDVDGNKIADFEIFVAGLTTLTSTDFVL